MEFAQRLISTRRGTLLISAVAALLAGAMIIVYVNRYRNSVKSEGAPVRTLVAARVVRIVTKGREGQATLYRLAPLDAFNRERVIAAVVSTWIGLNPKMLGQETGHQRARTVSDAFDDGSPDSP